MLIWRPSTTRRFTRRQVLLGAGKATMATVVVGTFADLIAACGGSSGETPASGGSGAATSASGSSGATSASGSSGATSAAGTPAASTGDEGTPVKGGELLYGTYGLIDHGSLDATTTTGTSDLEVMQGMEDTFVKLTPDGKFVPALAESWEISDDGTTYTFKLRQDVTFHDGTPLDAQAVKYNFDRITDQKRNPNGITYSYLGAGVNYQGCEVVDKYTVRHHLKEPNAMFMYRMRRSYFSPQSPAAIEKYGDQYFRNPVSVGYMKFGEWVENDHVTLVRNPDYKWGSPAIFKNTGPTYLDKLTHRLFKDLSTKATALESGEIDYAARLNPEDIVRFQSNKNIVVVLRDQTGQAVNLDMNCEKPPTNDKAVREAISWAIDRQALVKSVFFGLFEPAHQIFTPNMFSYDKSLESLIGHDPKKSEQILDQAGWTKGSSGTRAKDGQELKLIWLGAQDNQTVGQFVQAELQKVGIAVELKTLAGSGLQEAALRGDHNIYAYQHWIQEDPDVLRAWAVSSLINVRQNYIRVRNKELDDLLNKGISMPGDVHSPDRAKVYQQAQQIIMSNYYTSPLYYEKTLEAHRPYVHAKSIGYDPYGVYHQWEDVWMNKDKK